MCLFLYALIVFVFYGEKEEKETEVDRERERLGGDGQGQSHLKKNMLSVTASTVPTGKWGEKCQTVQYTDEDTDEHC